MSNSPPSDFHLNQMPACGGSSKCQMPGVCPRGVCKVRIDPCISARISWEDSVVIHSHYLQLQREIDKTKEEETKLIEELKKAKEKEKAEKRKVY